MYLDALCNTINAIYIYILLYKKYDFPTSDKFFLCFFFFFLSLFSLEIYEAFHFNAAWSKGRGCKRACKSFCVLLPLHFGCHGSNILCPRSYLHVAQRSNRTQRSTNLIGGDFCLAVEADLVYSSMSMHLLLLLTK